MSFIDALDLKRMSQLANARGFEMRSSAQWPGRGTVEVFGAQVPALDVNGLPLGPLMVWVWGARWAGMDRMPMRLRIEGVICACGAAMLDTNAREWDLDPADKQKLERKLSLFLSKPQHIWRTV